MLSVFQNGTFPPCPVPFNMAAHVLAKAESRFDKTALSVLGETTSEDWTYGQIEAAVRGIATGLIEYGLVPGDRVLLRLGNTPETPLAYLGAIAAGILPVPMAPQLTESEITKVIEDIAPALILRDETLACPDFPHALEPSAVKQMMDLAPADYVMGDPNRPAYVVYTSGTSGKPRAVVHAHRAIWARGMMHADWYELKPTDRLMHAGAFNWTYTMGTGLMDPWSIGATALIPADGTPLEALPGLLVRHKATLFAAAPGVYRKLLKHGVTGELPHLRHGLSAGEKLGDGTRSAWERATRCKIYEAFGMSECSTFISSNPHAPSVGASIGRPQTGRHVALLGPDKAPVKRGATGTISVHKDDPGLMLGYWNAPTETKARFAGDWFVTGDLGVMEADGAITYLGRSDDMMNAGGFRVSPLEVEAALLDAPSVEAVAVTDVEIKPDTQIIVAFYQSAQPIDKETLQDHASVRLASYKCPRDYVYVDAFPLSANGKVQRKALRSLWRPQT